VILMFLPFPYWKRFYAAAVRADLKGITAQRE
jgi:hypothetical protein